MPTSLMPNGRHKYFANNGVTPLAGGLVYTYAAGTTTPKAAYTDSAGAVPHANPIVLDAKGESTIFWDGAYKIDVKTSAGVSITGYPVDNFKSDPFGVIAFFVSLASYIGASLIGFIQTTAGAVLRTVLAKLRDHFGGKDYGAVGDGITDDRNAINTMLTNLTSDFTNFELYLPKGSYLIGSNLTIPTGVALRFHAGAKLIIPNGVTVTLNNPELLAGRQQIFQCTGTGVVVGTIRNGWIYPEWWGFIADGLHPPVGADFSARAAAAARNGAAIEYALAFAKNKYAVDQLSGTVCFPYGQAVYDRPMVVGLSVNVIGLGGVCTDLRYYAATGNAMEMINGNNSLLSDFALAPIAGPTWNYTAGEGLRVDNVSTAHVRNIWSSSFGGGCFYFNSAIESRFYGLVTDNANGNAFTIRGVGQGSVIEACMATNTDIGIDLDIQSGYDWKVIGFTSKNMRATATKAIYLNAVENISLTDCGTHDSNQEGILLTASALNCTINGCFVNGASKTSAGTYAAMNISGTRNKLIAPKVTQNTPTYSYALVLGGGGTDCSFIEENFTAGTVGTILDAQPTGSIKTKVKKVSTTTATPLNVWAKAFNNNAAARLEATVVAKQRGNAAKACYKFWALASTGTVSTVFDAGPTVTDSYESDPLLDATFVLTTATANAGVVSLQITGLAAGQPIDWEATVTSISVTG